MKKEIIRLITDLETGDILGAPLLDVSQIDVALGARDSSEFETNWLRVNELVTQHGRPDNLTATKLKRIRELAFRSAYKFSEHPGFSGYVADDFDLIGRALFCEVDDPWLSGLLFEYMSGRFPHGRVESVNKGLVTLLL
jgi:hypothetical protein